MLEAKIFWDSSRGIKGRKGFGFRQIHVKYNLKLDAEQIEQNLEKIPWVIVVD